MLEGLTPPNKDLCALMDSATNLEPADLKILLDALEDKRWSNNGLADALTTKGFKASESTIRKHRNKVCICAR